MDHEGDTLTLQGGLDIQGKLEFPNSYSGLTLRSTTVVVQGELEMASTGKVVGIPAVKFEMIGNRDELVESIGYCGGRTCMAGKKAITVAGGKVNIQDLPTGTKTWVKLYDVIGSGQQMVEGIVVPEDGVFGSWGVGADILITSHSHDDSEQQVRTIVSYDSNYGRGGYYRIMLDRPILRPTTTRDDRDFAVEVALLSRNIVFEGGDDNVAFHGGHFWIFETNAHEQRVDGVEIVNFGQAGELGRYPLQAHLCGDLSGSSFSRNSIRASHQRCVVVHATDNMLIEDNVAYSTGGHCYMLEDGMETGNRFIGNLGADTKLPARKIPNMGTNGHETDDRPATLWIVALGNTWIGNVAAGCDRSGYGWWFEPKFCGPLARQYADLRPERVNIKRFENNVAHSNGIGMNTYPRRGLRPENTPNKFVNFKAYRNQFKGLFVFYVKNLVIEGGIFADNPVNMDIDNSVNVELSQITVIGESDIFGQQIAAQRLRVPCLRNSIIGLQLDNSFGSILAIVRSASFSGFSATRCPNEYAYRVGNRAMSTESIPTFNDRGGDPVDSTDDSTESDTDDNTDVAADDNMDDNMDDNTGGGGDHALGGLAEPLYINCGGNDDGVWQADKYYSGGRAIQPRRDRPTLYNQYREENRGGLNYLIPVNDGDYEVTLYWAEYEHTTNNQCEFHVFMNGDRVLDDFDVHREARGRRKITKETLIARVRNDEELEIALEGTRDRAFLSLLAVRNAST